MLSTNSSAVPEMLVAVPLRLSVVCCRSMIVDASCVVGESSSSVIALGTLSISTFVTELSSRNAMALSIHYDL